MTRPSTAVTIFIFIMMATSALAGDPRVKLTQVAENHQKNAAHQLGVSEFEIPRAAAPSMLTEIQAVMDSTRNAELALREEFGDDQGPALTRRLGELKRASRMRILHIQLKYAKGEGRNQLERRILASIEDLQRPATPGGPRLRGGISPPSVVKPVVKPAGGSDN